MHSPTWRTICERCGQLGAVGAARGRVHNLDGPFGLSVLVWRLALKRELVELGVPKDEVPRLRQKIMGSTRRGRRSRFVLATGMWGCNTAEEIAAETGLSLAQVKSLAAAPIRRNVPRRRYLDDVTQRVIRETLDASTREADEVAAPQLGTGKEE